MAIKTGRLKGKLRRPRNAKRRRELAARDYYRRQQIGNIPNNALPTTGGEYIITTAGAYEVTTS